MSVLHDLYETTLCGVAQLLHHDGHNLKIMRESQAFEIPSFSFPVLLWMWRGLLWGTFELCFLLWALFTLLSRFSRFSCPVPKFTDAFFFPFCCWVYPSENPRYSAPTLAFDSSFYFHCFSPETFCSFDETFSSIFSPAWSSLLSEAFSSSFPIHVAPLTIQTRHNGLGLGEWGQDCSVSFQIHSQHKNKACGGHEEDSLTHCLGSCFKLLR